MTYYRLPAWGHDLRLGLRLVFWSFCPRVFLGRRFSEVVIGPWSLVHWRGDPSRWRIGP